MHSAVLEAVDAVSSSMSSSFKSPTSSPPPFDDRVKMDSPPLSFADTNGAPNVRANAIGPGGEAAANVEAPRSANGGGVAGARARANNGGTATTAASAAAAVAAAKPRVREAGPVNERSTVSSSSATPIGGGPTPTNGAPHNQATPKRPPREPLQQRHFDAAAAAVDENPFSSSAQKLMRSDTAPLSSRDVTASSSSAAVKNQQSPPPPTQQQQRRQQHVQAGIWAEQLAHRCFICPACLKVVMDPVLLVGDRKMVCRKCVPLPRPVGGVTELPLNLAEAIREIFAVGEVYSTADAHVADEAQANITAAATAAGSRRGSNTTATAASANGKAAAAGASVSPTGPVVATSATRDATEADRDEAPRAGARATGSTGGRSSGPSSRALKVQADKMYEDAEYTAALELYTKAIRMQPLDGQTQLRFLYGNRSAAHFMAQRYAECVADCLEVVKLEPGNVKMISRAARSAATMGDLKQAITILESTPPARLSGAMADELAKYRSGLDLYQKAEAGFGTPEGDEAYRMLVAQLADTIPFRTRFAESLMQRKEYSRATEVLEVTTASARPPKLCRLLAFCFYQSGFECFESARKALKEAAQLDSECAALLKLVNIVDEGKQKGNTNFTEKKFAVAVEHYTAAINSARDNDQILRILYCNRAAANKELGRYREGVEDCTKAISLDKDFYKAYARRARCHQNLGDHFAAVQDFRRAAQYDKSDKELARELRQAESYLQRETEREKDYYYQLGVQSTATDKEIKLKYRELSLRWHPDKCVSLDPAEKERAEHKFKVISEAYGNLIDPAKRREYDLRSSRSALGGKTGGFGGFSSTYSSFNTEQFRGRTRGAPGGYW